MDDKFNLWKKWFWVGVLIGLLNSLAGVVYGIAVLTEGKRREGLILILWSAAAGVLLYFGVIQLQRLGVLPTYRYINVNELPTAPLQ
jgi:zinc transporter ZupT